MFWKMRLRKARLTVLGAHASKHASKEGLDFIDALHGEIYDLEVDIHMRVRRGPKWRAQHIAGKTICASILLLSAAVAWSGAAYTQKGYCVRLGARSGRGAEVESEAAVRAMVVANQYCTPLHGFDLGFHFASAAIIEATAELDVPERPAVTVGKGTR